MTDQANAPDGSSVRTTRPAYDRAGRSASDPMTVASYAADLRDALRRATKDLHQQLDQAPEQRALLQPGLTVERYGTILHMHLHALTISEASLAALELARPDDLAPYRSRLPALEAELAALAALSTLAPTWAPTWATSHGAGPSLGTTPTSTWAPNQTATRLEPTVPPVALRPVGAAPDTDPALALGTYLGVRYVLEGSTQGAAVILRRLLRNLSEWGTHAFGFWRVQADEAPAWQALAEKLATLPARGPLAESATTAARGTFEVYLRAFGVTAPERDHAHSPHPGQGPAQR